ncbi:hypothetical protein EDD63_13319 [Breznakia blatticola]|uniref:Uncharacterized protein n=1 Tax=Breznakia blatticola TaxID=1754012 RepID=A0A4R7ZCY8_9FIRM|nr:hypothetical protein [Breznakia blatticola]TDW14736.1 hypothetical protein EDD63_13319 [Breznakia blatticola]
MFINKLAMLKVAFALSLPLSAGVCNLQKDAIDCIPENQNDKYTLGYHLPERNEMYVLTSVGKNIQIIKDDLADYELSALDFTLSNEETVGLLQGGQIKALQPGNVELVVETENHLELAKYTIVVAEKHVDLQQLHPHLEADYFTFSSNTNTSTNEERWLSSNESVVKVKDNTMHIQNEGTTTLCEKEKQDICGDTSIDVNVKADYISIEASAEESMSQVRYLCVILASLGIFILIGMNEYYRRKDRKELQ